MARTSIQACGDGDDDIGAPEAERRQQRQPLVGVGDFFAHQVLAGHAEMDGAGGELADDLGSREIGDFDARQVGDGAAIVARAASLHELQAGAGEERRGVFLQPPLGRHGEDERRLCRAVDLGGAFSLGGHARSPEVGKRSIHTAAPTAGTSLAAPSRRARPS